MKFLVTILLSFFYFIAPLQSYAKEISVTKIVHSSVNKPDKEAPGLSYSNPLADLFYLNEPTTNPGNGRSYVSDADMLSNDFYPLDIHLVANYFLLPSFLYCKSIGLILIFPEHYFF